MSNSPIPNSCDYLTRLSKSCHKLKRRVSEMSALQALASQAVTRTGPLEFAGLSMSLDMWDIARGLAKRGNGSMWHAHGECQIQYVFSGKVRFENERLQVTVSAGQGVIIAPMSNHKWQAQEDSEMLGVLLGFDGQPHAELFANIFGHDALNIPLVTAHTGSGWMADILEILLDDANPLRVSMMARLMPLWLMDFMRHVLPLAEKHSTSQADSDLTATLLCRHAESFMRANLEKSLTVQDIATHLGLSERHLHRIFVKHTGQTLHDSLIKMRLEKAYKLIVAGSPLQLKQIAHQCGFNSPAHFSAAFKKHFSQTPNAIFKEAQRNRKK